MIPSAAPATKSGGAACPPAPPRGYFGKDEEAHVLIFAEIPPPEAPVRSIGGAR